MNALVITLIVMLLLTGAATLILRVAMLRAADRIIKRRLVEISSTQLVPVTGEDLQGTRRARGPIQWVLGVLSTGVSRSWTSHYSTVVLLAWSLAAAGVCGAALGVGLRLPVLFWGPAAILGAFGAPQTLLRLEQGKFKAKFIDIFPEAIDMIVRMLRAGLPMSVAIGIVGVEGSSPVKEVFAKIGQRMSIGGSLEDTLRTEAKRLPLPDFRFFAVATSLQQATGGNLAVTLEILSEIIRKRRTGRMKAQAVTAEIRMSTMVLSAIPFLLIGAMLFVQPTYMSPLIEDRRGNVILAAAVLSLVTGLVVMSVMTKNATRL
jgi:tight adherence protein B